ncbi:MAG: LysM peptidoglycan-binding domain-containing protein [Planctomycetota bacterium]|nr:MAG: LysM peptidoglycan-binding domain-containing protein [Planctomycetota bacterium]RLS48154.1 MAG: LysM peptidoglycan-binding domain-containing protein [Planctomycetota bacterium]
MSNGARLSAVIVVVAVAAIGLYFAFMTPSGPARTENPKAPVDALVAPDAAAGIGEMSGSAAAAAGADNGAPAPEAFGAGSGTISVPGTTDPAGSTIAAPGAGAGSIAGGAAGAAAANANSTRTATPVTPTGSGTAGPASTGTASGGAVVPPVKVVTAPATPAAGTTQYTIKSGDTLEGIARTQMGDGQKWQLIAAANPGLDPKALKIGQKITIPASTTTASKDKAAVPAGGSTAAPNTYTVQKGDTLIELSRKFYGNDAEWKRILEANATTLKGDAKAIAPGMKLVIPAKR